MQKTRSYTYWKKPWAKWCVLAAGLLQLLALWINLNDYRQVSSVWDQIMSEDAWKSYASNMLFNCSLNGFMVLLFFACLLNGSLARSERTARRNDGDNAVAMGGALGSGKTVLSAALVQWTETLLVAAFYHGACRRDIKPVQEQKAVKTRAIRVTRMARSLFTFSFCSAPSQSRSRRAAGSRRSSPCGRCSGRGRRAPCGGRNHSTPPAGGRRAAAFPRSAGPYCHR